MNREKLKLALAVAGLSTWVREVQDSGAVSLDDSTPEEAQALVAAIVLEEKKRKPSRAERLATLLEGKTVEARAAFELAVLVSADDLPKDAREILEAWGDELLSAWTDEPEK